MGPSPRRSSPKRSFWGVSLRKKSLALSPRQTPRQTIDLTDMQETLLSDHEDIRLWDESSQSWQPAGAATTEKVVKTQKSDGGQQQQQQQRLDKEEKELEQSQQQKQQQTPSLPPSLPGFTAANETATTSSSATAATIVSNLNSFSTSFLIDSSKELPAVVTRAIALEDTAVMAKLLQQLPDLAKKCDALRDHNAALLKRMLQMQGNIQVCCRIRPLAHSEISKGHRTPLVEPLGETEVGCFDVKNDKWKSFDVDRVWGPEQSQASVFRDVEPLALSVADGYNACVFAYGQTKSGKTYTMEGETGNKNSSSTDPRATADNHQYGITYRSIETIFHLLTLRAEQHQAAAASIRGAKSGGDDEKENSDDDALAFNFSVEIGMLEVNNDEVHDLLGSRTAESSENTERTRRPGSVGSPGSSVDGRTSLEIRQNKEGRVEIPHLTKTKVNNIIDVLELMRQGKANRLKKVASSRSHMILRVDVSSGVGEVQNSKGTLYLVDLAASDRIRGNGQLKEAGFINRSLSTLGNVIEALDRKAPHIPYRDSKLTYMLQDSLGGNSRTMMILNLCPVRSYDESMQALQFATRVRRIKISAAQRNVTSKNLEETVKNLTEEMKASTLAKDRTENKLQVLKRENTRVQERLNSLLELKSLNQKDNKTFDVLRKNNDDLSARWQKERAAREEASEELDSARKELRVLQQQIGKFESKMQLLECKLEEKQRQLDESQRRRRQEKQGNAILMGRRSLESSFKMRPPATPSRSLVTPANPRTPDSGVSETGKFRNSRLVASPKRSSIITSAKSPSHSTTPNESSAATPDLSLSGILSPARTNINTTQSLVPPSTTNSGASATAKARTSRLAQSPQRSSIAATPNASLPGVLSPQKEFNTPQLASVSSIKVTTTAETEEQSKKLSTPSMSQIRTRVLELLQKYDAKKVDRVDLLLEKFKGREMLLLQKLTQRYAKETTPSNATVTARSKSTPDSVQSRAEMAAERHRERLRKFRESKNRNPY